MNRRAMLATWTSGAALAFFPAGADAKPGESEILRLYRAYIALTDAADTHPSLDDDELDRLFYFERDAIEDRLISIPSTCAADLAAKMLVAHNFGDFSCLYDCSPVWNEARALLGGLVPAERLPAPNTVMHAAQEALAGVQP
ncbi:hypothetical protein [Pararhodobacter zhoushanensis]|uniref:Tat (Twin-arginine translocation) pathway signal sequence n=1 Tax=Pararhodobacter zhoushanensis TaxID=2479545 RepID=A0ABT3GW42_9RHOB|nr:hypothetical protein [Pararhodobacter zhoushanensis]MCW1931735.1 hypothetical protein [Pararhodobacter zhoushanensis]